MSNNSPLHGYTRILLLIIPYFFVMGFFQLIGLLFAKIADKNIDINKLSTQQHFIISFFGCIGTFLILYFFMKHIDKERFILMGFHIKTKGKDILTGIIIGLIIMGFSYFFLIALNEITYLKINFNFKEIIYSIFLYIFVSFSEEILFRGYILKNLLNSVNSYLALVLSALLFSLIHSFNPNIDWISFLGLFLGGILLGISYIHTRNLWFPIALHFSWNFFQTLFGFNISGQNFYSLIEFEITKKSILNGGFFGFEGSIISIIVQLLLIIFGIANSI
ncbi:CPBP family intramembrane metalloprotease [Tenacibaculum finnmarkense]|nr:CPBP family intramembrane metalloprotease [Tenacibaculum finnmarkense genomovar finnmarkense]MCG8724391.1 CPBP family intramembrane metalloprotease [Tenacibaculum finnmarkense]MCG8742707.1 CPBP family intramembrane metalloprotease [Tenacibaculum finnmarkense]MCG8766114.1 CPBP family intramembrane metalloprotease [Tenacibaculum finnmarkense]MCG8779067.1 CPBP family intramembrane metalloprotease [Tenacibaculum finnmarkense]